MSVEGKENSIDPVAVRGELKAWETAFKEQNGRKAGREDIKKDAIIQAKYKLYNELTSRASRPKIASTPSKSIKHSRIEKPAKATPKRTPSKKQSTLQAPVLSPVQEAEPTPAFIRNALGPTPHRDGQVLSIFDIAIENTPLKGDSPSKTNGISLIAGTPSKSAATASEESGHSRTPQSLSKRYFLDAFAGTPLKRKRDDNDIGTTSSSKRKFATPSFLRRSAPLAPIAEDNAETSTSLPPPFRKRGLVRSLSSIIQGLKKQEEKRMDDEWDVMNEIEEEEANGGPKEVPAKIQVEDSQDVEMPLGPDQAAESSESEEEDRDTGRKPWKKKGLKRQTRRVKMKPVVHKPQKAEADEESEEEEFVTETQLQHDPGEPDELAEDSDSGSETEQKAKRKSKQTANSKSQGKEVEKEEPKKGGRKVDPLAHANFRALKIKNKNSKAGGRRGKFGRR
ncbi:DNA replication regulator SLD2 [Pseudocercospora fuligena]|uniref:DNA replication regulator SLD2 n=1 Tax=Pseudocercospora fuligena TaxID=685502 RepID=A0A8H6VCI6_9PEZI|nr:DNA replication regulator SLD2 [Pseudocercospora fuligena]